MNHQKERDSLGRYLAGQSDAAESERIDQWYVQHAAELPDQLPQPDYPEAKSAIWRGIQTRNKLVSKDNEPVSKHSKSVRKLHPYVYAAAAIAVITLGVWLYYSSAPRHSGEGRNPASAQYANDIKPGKNTATLTLASGKVINLDTNRTSVTVTDSVKTVMMLTASTPRGGQYQVVLPDGTRVWLNADSKIEFASNFLDNNIRNLKLEGEAYFEVAKNKAKPFIVETAERQGRPAQRVEVLGTHFNINSYPDEGGIKTTLLEGSVQITSPSLRGRTEAQGGPSLREGTTKQPRGPSTEQREATILKPNQQSILSDNNLIKVTQVNPSEAIAWKNGDFEFNEESLSRIARKLERWYNVEIQLTNNIGNKAFTGKISRSRNISQVLNMMEETNSIQFKIEGRRITAIEK